MPTAPPSLLILGTDAVLAAAPSTAVQLTHACLAAGFDAVIPASWGDELIAARVLERLAQADHPVVQCSCPLVAHRLAEHADALESMLLCVVSPPVATAGYLRALYAPARPHITYAGGCQAGSSDTIDAWLSPDELLGTIADRGISVASQPREFDAVLAPDRRRFHSDPGGAPAGMALRALARPVDLVEVSPDDFVAELAQRLLDATPVLVDVSCTLGCPCSGAVPGGGAESARSARARVRELEPPRAPGPVIEHTIPVSLDADLPVLGAERPQRVPAPVAGREVAAEPVSVAVEAPRRRSPTGTRRSVLGAAPHARTDVGRKLPRAFVARRRSSPRGVRAQAAAGPRAPAGPPRHWPIIAAAGVGVGVALAWLLGLAR